MLVLPFGLPENLFAQIESCVGEVLHVQAEVCYAAVFSNMKSIDGLRFMWHHPLQDLALDWISSPIVASKPNLMARHCPFTCAVFFRLVPVTKIAEFRHSAAFHDRHD